MWLTFAGKRLEVGRSLASCGLRAGSTVHLAVRGRGGGCCNCKEGVLKEQSFVTLSENTSDGQAGQSRHGIQQADESVSTLPEGNEAALTADTMALILSELDDSLVERLRADDIRLLRPSWLLQPSVKRILRRQELEALEQQGESPLLRPEEAVALIKQGKRGVGALT